MSEYERTPVPAGQDVIIQEILMATLDALTTATSEHIEWFNLTFMEANPAMNLPKRFTLLYSTPSGHFRKEL